MKEDEEENNGDEDAGMKQKISMMETDSRVIIRLHHPFYGDLPSAISRFAFNLIWIDRTDSFVTFLISSPSFIRIFLAIQYFVK
jgi:hypothetical protein